MQVNPYTFTIAQAALMSQVAELQDLGHLHAPGTNLAYVHESMMRSAFQGMAPGSWHSGFVTQFTPGKTEDSLEFARSLLASARSFEPNSEPDFQPQQVIMQKGDQLVPMIIEKRDFIGAKEVLGERGRRELAPYGMLAQHPEMEAMTFLLRSWDGAVHALCVGAVTCFDEGMTFLCSRDVKFDRKRKTKLRDVGPVMTLARLLYMKQRGFWSDAAPVLMDIRPDVLERYRRNLPKVPARIERDDWSISRKEADYLLLGSPHQLVPLPMPSKEPAAG